MEDIHYVYIIRSLKSGFYYTGCSSDPERRLVEHNSGQTNATRGKGPWIRIYLSDTLSLVEARALEQKIKGRGAGRFLEDIAK